MTRSHVFLYREYNDVEYYGSEIVKAFQHYDDALEHLEKRLKECDTDMTISDAIITDTGTTVIDTDFLGNTKFWIITREKVN